MDNVINGKQITWVNSTRGLADASTLGFPPGVLPESIQVRSHRTGRVVEFILKSVIRDQGIYISLNLAQPVDVTVFDD
ncbi:MAG: hypothetical protein EBT03_10865 [Betaproteobacteria bacterium]|nr:hypothetical protein [Betaproteobacteria bacterium]